MYHALGMWEIHGITSNPSLPFTLLVATLTTRHPCHVAVTKTATEFAQMYCFLEGGHLPVSEDEMWWKDLQNDSFPAATVSISTKYIYIYIIYLTHYKIGLYTPQEPVQACGWSEGHISHS